jgi:hypothetical protein
VLVAVFDGEGKPLFDKVAYLEKSGVGARGNEEHHGFYESVRDAVR